MNIVGQIHEKFIFSRRTRVLANHIGRLIPQNANVLDVGCGDGTIDKYIKEFRSDIQIMGIDVMLRPESKIPVKQFDGERIPYADNSFETVIFVDVLHHTEDPQVMLKEACRVAKDSIILKDHTRNGFAANFTLRLMDWVGNAHHNVDLPYNYWSEEQWRTSFRAMDVCIEKWINNLELYRWPASCLFDRQLHFISKLSVD